MKLVGGRKRGCDWDRSEDGGNRWGWREQRRLVGTRTVRIEYGTALVRGVSFGVPVSV